jgi:hypothetical protein
VQACDRLVNELQEAIEEFESTFNVAHPNDIVDRIDFFAQELFSIPGVDMELARRASLVAESCGSGTQYATSKDSALKGYRGRPKRITASKAAIKQLRASSDTPYLQDSVKREAYSLDVVLKEKLLGIRPEVLPQFEHWRAQCRTILHAAERVEADGSHYLYHTAVGLDAQAQEHSKGILAIMHGPIGAAHYQNILDAIHSIVAWAAEAVDKKIWSNKSDSPSQWAKQFGVSLSTLKRRVASGEIRVKKSTTKSWYIHVDDIPD